MIFGILNVIFYCLGIYLLANVLYLLYFAIAGFFKIKLPYAPTQNHRRICVLIPAYKEDAVIIESALDAKLHQYEGEFDVCVIADKLMPSTIETLSLHNVKVIEVRFEKSTKGKALSTALSALPLDAYDLAVVLDADNIMGPAFLEKVNSAFEAGYKVIQGHRTAKNQDTPFALLDACNEEINNHLFRRGHQRSGLSAALIGSGMAFDYHYLIKLLSGIGETVGEDKEIDFRIIKDGIKIAYLEDAWVYDEKVADSGVFLNQRTRWIAAQIEFLKKYFIEGFVLLFRNGNIEFFNKMIQTLLLPRILLLGVLSLFVVISFALPVGPSPLFWLVTLICCGAALLLSLPKRLYNKDLIKAVVRLPLAFITMCIALLSINKAKKSFIHTPHTSNSKLPINK
ncbi:hypothetical protein EL17_05620 [Anditalea andensis]|uniref:Glycosyl transferase family 2 n=2 Tax=Anditalea andensis TaxID=1048983 RepID=A0A074LMP5_9BACT|nr:hypothetical protein EL17_05620 [Anditalea andensis]